MINFNPNQTHNDYSKTHEIHLGLPLSVSSFPRTQVPQHINPQIHPIPHQGQQNQVHQGKVSLKLTESQAAPRKKLPKEYFGF
jgi:hypothetical protein